MEKKFDYTKPWTSLQRYRAYKEYNTDYVTTLTDAVIASLYRNTYHIEPATGLLNDPNGFSYFNGKYHLFYQVFPYGPVHGLKSWALMTSIDLIHWENEGLKILPDTIYDSHGAYSGSAIPLSEDELFIFYTGNTRGADQSRAAYQNGAIYGKNGQITKFEQPLLTTPAGYTNHFRDPMVFKVDDQAYAVIGAQRADETGTVVLAKADKADLTSWHYQGELHFTDEALGYMVECPNIVLIDQKPVLIFCPQGLDKNVCEYDNIFPNMYVIADSLDLETPKLLNPSEFHRLDDGFEVYATQAFNAPDGRVLASSWLGLPDIDVPSQADGVQGILSLVKELTLKDGKLYQYPVRETLSLRQDVHEMLLTQDPETQHTNSYELEVELSSNQTLYLFANADKTSYVSLNVDMGIGKITLDRENLPVSWAEEYGFTRSTYFDTQKETLKLNIFADTSSLEIFVNDGEKVMSSRIFTAPDHTHLFSDGAVKASLWTLKK